GPVFFTISAGSDIPAAPLVAIVAFAWLACLADQCAGRRADCAADNRARYRIVRHRGSHSRSGHAADRGAALGRGAPGYERKRTEADQDLFHGDFPPKVHAHPTSRTMQCSRRTLFDAGAAALPVERKGSPGPAILQAATCARGASARTPAASSLHVRSRDRSVDRIPGGTLRSIHRERTPARRRPWDGRDRTGTPRHIPARASAGSAR